jgi:hypothetical protein
MSSSIEELEKRVNEALAKLRENDDFLLKNEVNERTITHKLAEYLQQEFPDWNVDCEYNRYRDIPKWLKVPKKKINWNWNDVEGKTVFPDIIIHHRNLTGAENNLLVIETKKSTSTVGKQFDERKLEGFTSSQYNYQFGLYILFYVNEEFKNDPDLEWYKDGRKLLR